MNRAASGRLRNGIDLEAKFTLCLVALTAVGSIAFRLKGPPSSFMGTLLVIAGVGVVAGLAHAFLFQPIRRLRRMAQAMGAGDFSKRLRFVRPGEIGKLARGMDTMCDQLEAAHLASEAHIAALEQLRHSDRVATLGRLASSVAHELGNPLNVIELRAQLIASGDMLTLQQAQQSALVIVEQTRRMTRIIDEILSFARMQPAKITCLDLADVLRKAVTLSEHTSRKHKTSVVLDVPASSIEVDGDADKLLQIFVNLVVNGVEAMPGGGSLQVSARDEVCPAIDDPLGVPRSYVCIDVTDHGVGIPAQQLAKVFQPFFSTKSADGGTGLGLSVAQGIAREHEGWISVESEVGRGSSFQVHLPKHSVRGGNGYAA